MRMSVFALSAVTLAGGGAAPATAATIVADFTGPSLPVELGVSLDPGFTLSVGGGYATLTFSAPPSTTSQSATATIFTKAAISGDYSITVDVDFSGLPAVGSDLFTDAGLLATTSDRFARIGGFNDGGSSRVTAFETVGSAYQQFYNAASANNQLTFRLDKVGDTLMQSFAPVGSSSFILAGSSTAIGNLAPSTLGISAFFQGTRAVTNASVRFSNLTLVVADVAAVPEPSTWAMMLIGFGMIGGAARYRRRSTKVAYA